MNYRALYVLIVSAALTFFTGACASSGPAQKTGAEPSESQADTEKPVSELPEHASALEGTWQGKLEVSGVSLTVVYHLERSSDAPGGWVARMDSPDQGATGIPVSAVHIEDTAVQLEVAAVAGVFEGNFDADADTIDGTWTQSGQTFPLLLKRATSAQAYTPARPQEPAPPYPYNIEEVEFAGGTPTAGTEVAVKLAGTLTLPKTQGPHPVLVLLTGSGPQDRDETILHHKPFWILADFLSRNGVAVLRFDDRGVAQSTGVFQGATIADFTSDAVAAVDFLSTRQDINPEAIGLLGHSEGANVAPLAALASDKVKFTVLLAPTAVPGTELLARQNALVFETMGMSPEGASAYEKRMLAALNKIVKVPLDQPLSDALKKELRADFKAAAAKMSPDDRKHYGPTDPAAFEKVLDALLGQLNTAWMRSFLHMKPAETFTKLQLPTLALYGSKDLQVPPAQNAAPLREQLAHNKQATITLLDGLNHLFQPSETGHPGEYGTIETTLDPTALDAILSWLTEHGLARAN